MDGKDYLCIDDRELARLETVYAGYRRLHDDPQNCRPMIVINTPVTLPTWEARLADPLVMLRAELDLIRPHLAIGDDRVPSVRVQFGTAQVAAAFGCEMFLPENNLPAAGNHVLANAEDVYQLAMPDLTAGWYGKLAEWTALWQEQLPAGVHMQHPDIQSAFNSAQLIRGNDIFTDFYDRPEAVDALLDRVTDFMLAITRHTKAQISRDPDWFFDWGAMWKGSARISNCSMQMISPQLYGEHVLPRDIRFFDRIGGGRMHYCGRSLDIVDEFFKVPAITGLDVDCEFHDFFALCDHMPERVVLMPTIPLESSSPVLQRLLRGEWPKKRNIVIFASAPSIADGQTLFNQLSHAMPN